MWSVGIKNIVSVFLFMGNSINLAILLPAIPLGMALFLFLLLRLFTRTINRLTKPVSYLAISSILFSTFLSLFFLSNHIEGQLDLSQYLSSLKNANLEFHLNSLTEKIIIIIGVIISLVITFSMSKLPRQKGYVLYIINLSLVSSLLISASLILDLPSISLN